MRLSRLIVVAVLLVLALPALAVGANTSSADAPHLHVQLVLPQDQLYPGATSDSIYQNSLNPNYKKVGEYPYSGRMWSLYVIEPAAQALTRSPDSTPDLKPDSKPCP